MPSTFLTQDLIISQVRGRLEKQGIEVSDVRILFDIVGSQPGPDIPLLLIRSGDKYASIALYDLNRSIDQCIDDAVHKSKEWLADAKH